MAAIVSSTEEGVLPLTANEPLLVPVGFSGNWRYCQEVDPSFPTLYRPHIHIKCNNNYCFQLHFVPLTVNLAMLQGKYI